MIRVVAPSRLHFGLFRVPTANTVRGSARVFGGVGLMIERPGVAVVVRPADSWQFEGPLASRAQAFAARFMFTMPEEHRRAFQVLVERCPVEHTGLGVGTQLGLAVAKALAVALDRTDVHSVALAARIGRGERSAIGVYGFDSGGLIVEGGKQPGQDVSPLVEHVTLPDAWRVVLFAPNTASRWHGEQERSAFATASEGAPESLLRLAETAIVPAAQKGDIDAFGDAVYEFNRKAGEPFAAAQGGTYASTEIAELIAEVRKCGVKGVGQSSWGPTVFAVVGDGDTALSLVERFRGRVPAFVTRVSVGGHAVQCDPPSGG
jgi:beta-ribofuranosylaminobenzene 5'-phosphate synthase